MKKTILIFIAFLALALNIFASPNLLNVKTQDYKYVKVVFNSNFTSNNLREIDIDAESAQIEKEEAFLYVSDLQLLKMDSLGAKYTVLIDNVSNYYTERNKYQSKSNTILASGFKTGSVGGFYTRKELDDEIKDISNTYSGMLSKISTYKSNYNQNINVYKLGKGSDGAPSILITALHHAREPQGIMSLIYFIRDILNNYSLSDPSAKYLLENRNIYIIPMLNPDGYQINEQQYPDGGGMWRKNGKIIDFEIVGVDLNRNYGPQEDWVLGDDKSSSDIYRGSAPFSEPETQAVKDLCEKYKFSMVMNLHTFGNFLIYPYGPKSIETKDSVLYAGFGYKVSKSNHYVYGRDNETINYISHGSSDDWMYENDMLAFTPEIGNNDDGFWPPKSRIPEIAEETLKMFYESLWAVNCNLTCRDASPDFDGVKSFIKLDMQNIGLKPTNLQPAVSIISLDDKCIFKSNMQTANQLLSGERIQLNFEVELRDGNDNGGMFAFEVNSDMGEFGIRKDTVQVQLAYPELISVFDQNNPSAAKISGDWQIVQTANNTYQIEDSPNGSYEPSSYSNLIFAGNYYLNDCKYAALELEADWRIEPKYDFFTVYISSDSGKSWENIILPGMVKGYGNSGSYQKYDEYGWHGFTKSFLIKETSLDKYINKKIQIKCTVSSDKTNQQDGVKIRNIKIRKYKESAVSVVNDIENSGIRLIPSLLNIGISNLKIVGINPEFGSSYQIFDVSGAVIDAGVVSLGNASINVNFPSSGIYFVKFTEKENFSVHKIIVMP